jgi:lincosamide nucleotidyltransferase A/C/D/E
LLEHAFNRFNQFIDEPPDTSQVKILLRRLRARLRPQMDLDDVLETWAVLEEEGLRCWLAGGWGVDALIGSQTRDHFDLDVVIEDFERDEPRVCLALAKLGYVHRETTTGGIWMPPVSKLSDGAGRRIELMSIDWKRLAGAFGLDNGGQRESPAVLLSEEVYSEGMIGGRSVPCLSRRAQLLFHTGFPPTSNHLRDLAALSDVRE